MRNTNFSIIISVFTFYIKFRYEIKFIELDVRKHNTFQDNYKNIYYNLRISVEIKIKVQVH